MVYEFMSGGMSLYVQVKEENIFLIDFAEVFDSVSWEFLLNVMRARAIPQKWLKWI